MVLGFLALLSLFAKPVKTQYLVSLNLTLNIFLIIGFRFLWVIIKRSLLQNEAQ